jgi:CDP-diacylglycerol--serine O-phosphatidyltransferase
VAVLAKSGDSGHSNSTLTLGRRMLHLDTLGGLNPPLASWRGNRWGLLPLAYMNLIRQIPNILTLSNLLMGTLAIFLLNRVDFEIILYLFAGCLVADILDGALARRMGVAGELGIQLDSLADVVSFGVLPAYIIYHLPVDILDLKYPPILGLILPAIIAVSAGLRLARFNVDTRPREFFWGLATPSGAIMVMSIAWAFRAADDPGQPMRFLELVVYVVPIFLAVMYQVPLKLPGLKSPRPALITLGLVGVFILIGLVVWGPIAIALGIVLYVGLGLLNLVIKWY